MKYVLTLFLYSCTFAFAATFEIIGPCFKNPLFTTKFDLQYEKKSTVGSVTLEILKKNKIPFLGTEQGINSIFNTPTGRDAYEVFANNDINAYGWCFAVNDFSPELYPHEIEVHANDKITWWFGYAQYKDGKWITQCLPSYLRKAPQFCSKK